MQNPRYDVWLSIADELTSLHTIAYDPGGALYHPTAQPLAPTANRAANSIREKCQKGWWYWWDKGWLGGIASEPLLVINRLLGDGGGRYEEMAAGQDLIARITRISKMIDNALEQ